MRLPTLPTQPARPACDYLIEQNRVLLELQGSKSPRLNDDQRRRLAVKAKAVAIQRKAYPNNTQIP